MEDNKNKVIKLPLIPLRGLSIFPYMVLHFDVGREKSIKALEEAIVKDQLIFLTTQKEIDVDLPTPEDFYEVGTISKIKQMLKLPGDTIRVLVEGISRGKIKKVIDEEPFFSVEVEEYKVKEYKEDKELEAFMRAVLNSFEDYISVSNKISPEVLITVSTIEEAGRLADVIASHMLLKTEQKQEILEAFDPKDRLEVLYKLLLKEIEILEVEKEINTKVRKQINRLQKEYYLKEQLKAIREELGEDGEYDSEIEEFYERIEKAKLPKEVEKKVYKEIDRLSKLAPGSAEGGVIRTYVNWILDLPWNKKTKDNIDIKRAKKILDEDHYGLHFVKERILEYLAIRKLAKNMKGPIICLVGPPGVGKTSIARSIARSLNRKFVRMSLGGVRDEAEIRGHRRTYVGAIPGRIISAIKDAGFKNPVFLFDEIDKLNSDFRGDPASALLEVLDPEQNKEFTDRYLEVPFDLSNVMFITTANSLGTIPRPLLDRMEVIEVSGYTEEEKIVIAEKYLVPKQIKEHGMKKNNLQISKSTLRDIVNYYTRESGVRELERQIATICRKAARQIVENNKKVIRVTKSNLKNYLGIPKYRYEKVRNEHEVGIATGLAWTRVGGDTLFIEVTPMKGTGKLVLTGQLGDVMKESARAGLSYIRSKAGELNIDEEFYKNLDIHIHIPEGAIPKDGPSAGITMATAVISALSGIPINKYVAMTGEITLRGRVLPVGGIKEKVLAANRAGIKKVLLPIENKKDLSEIPESVKKKLEFVFVSHMDQVLEHALVKGDRKDEN
ncbi:ATP-dependent proteinase. Serine peptidase. MEROPS family S16 [Caminicella sporogenes DSM 14501]|uniref:Lon protease n=1 Tax=Caminicella sporogenes DSM 14501 TaxID=1121266 RepID=A0A1M6NYL4_9FIRM|nr:endopeptidase La [Caminicella sporogenes]RKD21596.1 endopeptidase La [Caminicella sporogenes]SHK00741.1 ATP-dependent proteinase. Serine peptidase. MEROPS family S16 [Caminicella sporogenes DSM 14501]